MTDIDCTGRDDITRTFQYDYEEDTLDHQWIFRVYTKPPLANRPAFEMIFDEIDDETVRQTSPHHHGVDEYRARCIPDAMLPRVTAPSQPGMLLCNALARPANTQMTATLKSQTSMAPGPPLEPDERLSA
jgi:hypothetical protein